MAQKNIIKRIISSPLVQAFLIYVSGGWIVLEIADYIINNYGLNERVRDVLSIILLIGLPVAIFLAWYLSREKEEIKEKAIDAVSERTKTGIFRTMRKKPWFSIPGVVILVLLILTSIRYIHRHAKINWAKEHAIPQMENCIHDNSYVDAFQLRQKVKKYVSDDPEFIRLDNLITRRFTIITNPERADVYYKAYPDVGREWTFLGTSPLYNLEMPNATIFRYKFENTEYEDVYAVASTHMDTLFRTMHKIGKVPDGMVFVEGINDQTASDFLSLQKHGFFIDKYEVTNKQFKEFIDLGGYQNPEFWQSEFILNNDTLAFEEAMSHFIDATGRAGPVSWEAGDYPNGQEDYPVCGISWYEADAYAVYVGKSLPTIDHWRSAAGLKIESYSSDIGLHIIPLSNIGGTGPEPVGSNQGLSCFGTYDMAGNVREWCWNESPVGRIVQGGAWNDVGYISDMISPLPLFDRSVKNGFRCVLIPDREQIPMEVFHPFKLESQRDYRFEEPVSEIEYQILVKQFLYDKTDLNSKVEDIDEMPADWIIEKVSFDAAYEQERMMAYLLLPKNAVPPYQTIVYFPGTYAFDFASIFGPTSTRRYLYYIIKNGRAVMYPIYKGTYERSEGPCNISLVDYTHQYTECVIKWVKDFSRSIDYLETRVDIDTANLGYMGDSWGGTMGAIIPAVENRLKLGVLIRGGLPPWNHMPEVDEINYVTHVEIPILMLGGKYDFILPYETSAVSMFDLLGTPEENKRMAVYETGHFVPRTEMIKETLNWFDKYFGPVSK